MASQSRKVLLAVLTVALLLATGSCVSEEDVKASAEDVKDNVGEAAEKAKESTESWAGWAMEKISGSFNNGGDDAIKESGKMSVSDFASEVKEKLSGVASGGGEKAKVGKEKDGEVAEAAKKGEDALKENLGDVTGSAKGTAEEAVEVGKRAAGEAKEKKEKEKHGAEL